LDRGFEDLPLAPYLNDTTNFLLNFVGSTFVGGGRSFSYNRGKSNEEVILFPGAGLLGDFIGEVDEVEALVGTRIFETLEPDGCGAVCMSPGEPAVSGAWKRSGCTWGKKYLWNITH